MNHHYEQSYKHTVSYLFCSFELLFKLLLLLLYSLHTESSPRLWLFCYFFFLFKQLSNIASIWHLMYLYNLLWYGHSIHTRHTYSQRLFEKYRQYGEKKRIYIYGVCIHYSNSSVYKRLAEKQWYWSEAIHRQSSFSYNVVNIDWQDHILQLTSSEKCGYNNNNSKFERKMCWKNKTAPFRNDIHYMSWTYTIWTWII